MYSQQHITKQALAAAVSALGKQVAKKTFTSGLLAPIHKALGGVQKTLGYGQKGLAYAKNLNKPLSEMDDASKALLEKGRANIAAGGEARALSGFRSGLKGQADVEGVRAPFSAENPLSFRAGRLLGGIGIGAPIMAAPFTAAEYLGGATTSNDKIENIAKSEALKRIQQRTQEYADTPFLDRLKTIFSPQDYTAKMLESSPEALDLYDASQRGINNPGIMKYIMSFNPFLGSADSVMREKVRSEILRQMGQNKQANVGVAAKGGLNLAKNIISKAWQGGRAATKNVGDLASKELPALATDAPVWQNLLNKGIYGIAKSPGSAALGAAGIAAPVYLVGSSFGAGRDAVYDQAAQDARALADLQFAGNFGQEGFGAGLMRTIAALAPGLMQNYVNSKATNEMYGNAEQSQTPGNLLYQ